MGTPQAQFLGEVVFGALYTGTGPGVPVMRRGAGWRRRPGVVSLGVWHPLISLHACMGMEKHTHATTVSEPQPPQPPQGV